MSGELSESFEEFSQEKPGCCQSKEQFSQDNSGNCQSTEKFSQDNAGCFQSKDQFGQEKPGSCQSKEMLRLQNCILEEEIEQLELEDKPIQSQKKSFFSSSVKKNVRYKNNDG